MLYEQCVFAGQNTACVEPTRWMKLLFPLYRSQLVLGSCTHVVRVVFRTVQTPWSSTRISLSNSAKSTMPNMQWHTSLMLGSWTVGRTSSNVHRRWSDAQRCALTYFRFLCLHCLGLRCTVESECFASVGRLF